MTDPVTVIENITMQIQETEEEFIYTQILPYCEYVTQKRLDKAELKKLLLLGMQKETEKSFTPDEVWNILIEHGQHDMRFKLGEIIKYSPSEVLDILKEVKTDEIR